MQSWSRERLDLNLILGRLRGFKLGFMLPWSRLDSNLMIVGLQGFIFELKSCKASQHS